MVVLSVTDLGGAVLIVLGEPLTHILSTAFRNTITVRFNN